MPNKPDTQNKDKYFDTRPSSLVFTDTLSRQWTYPLNLITAIRVDPISQDLRTVHVSRAYTSPIDVFVVTVESLNEQIRVLKEYWDGQHFPNWKSSNETTK